MGVGALKQSGQYHNWPLTWPHVRLNCPKSASVTAVYQRLSMTLVRANVRALLSRVISDTGY